MIPYNPISLPGVIKNQTQGSSNSSTSQEEATVSASEANPSHGKLYYSTLYFGYSSNLSPETMKQRCPDSLFTGLARLDGWRWVINSSRYANLVRSPGDVVYGTLCFLSNRDENALDLSEGVPWWYQKLYVPVTRLNADGSEMVRDNDGTAQVVEALAYIDETRLETDCVIEPDYVVFVNKAIRDALLVGMPQSYVDKYLRPYTPLPTGSEAITMVRTAKQLNLKMPVAPERGPDGELRWV